jgi:hypothetical protein
MGIIDNWFEFGGDGGASIWMEGLDWTTPGVTCHSGSRCVGMELTDIAKSRRNEFNIHGLENLVGNELYVSVWLYLPANWQLHQTTGNNWYEIVNPFFTDAPSYLPYSAIEIYQPDIAKKTFNLDFQAGTGSTEVRLDAISNWSLPRGRWFNVQYYVFRDPTNGIVRVWVDGTLLFDANNIATKNPSIAKWFTTVGKIYYDTHDTFSPYQIWVDDLTIYGTSPIPGFPWESTLAGVIIGLGVLAVMRRRRNLASS